MGLHQDLPDHLKAPFLLDNHAKMLSRRSVSSSHFSLRIAGLPRPKTPRPQCLAQSPYDCARAEPHYTDWVILSSLVQSAGMQEPFLPGLLPIIATEVTCTERVRTGWGLFAIIFDCSPCASGTQRQNLKMEPVLE